jgi:hydrogenase small subunit
MDDERMARAGIDRRTLLRWGACIAGTLALPLDPFAQRIAEAAQVAPRLPVLWLNGQDCTGDIEGLLRTGDPTPSELLLDRLSLDYTELLMAPAGTAAEGALARTVKEYAGKYVVVVEGSIPTAAKGMYCCVGGRTFVDILTEAASGAVAVIAAGTCAVYGGLPAATGGVTGASSVTTVLSGTKAKIINFPGCPLNGENLTAALVQYATLGTWPETDSTGLPLFAYGTRIHPRCERLPFFRAGKFVRTWGDAGHQAGWCLRNVGCQGPQTSANCATARFNAETSWPVASGAPCLGCTRSTFWSQLSNAFTWTPPATTAAPPASPATGVAPSASATARTEAAMSPAGSR